MGQRAAAKAFGFGFVQQLEHRQGQVFKVGIVAMPCILLLQRDEMRVLLLSLCRCSALNLLLKWSGREAPVFVDGNPQWGWVSPVPAVLQGPFGLPQLERALPCSGWDLPSVQALLLQLRVREMQKALCSSEPRTRSEFLDCITAPGFMGRSGEITFPRLLQSPKPPDSLQRHWNTHPGHALHGHGIVAEFLHIFGTGWLSRRPKVFK